jgi:hypothetical protein
VNEFLPGRFVERVERLILGIEPIDAERRARIARPIDLVLDGVPHPPMEMSWRRAGFFPDPIGALREIPRHNSCRHALVFPPGMASPITIRMYDRSRRFVPRRISYPIPADIRVQSPPSRVRRPALFPGAAYDVSPTATGMRGRVTWSQSVVNEVPARWVRVEAAVNGQIVGRAHGDDRGEFLLILRSPAGGLGDQPSPLEAQVRVFGPAAPPPIPANDPLGDLPVETLVADPDAISAGETMPPGYAANLLSTRTVTFQLGTLLTNQDKFFFQV